MNKIILFDGVCNFCNRSVQFIIKRDPKAQFQFASLQSEVGQKLLEQYHESHHINSIVLIEENQCYFRSSAALRICKHLSGLWKLFYIFIVIPSPIRDFCYDILAKNRYKWFGESKSCQLPSREEQKRFL